MRWLLLAEVLELHRRQRGHGSGELHAVGDGQAQVSVWGLNAGPKGLATAATHTPWQRSASSSESGRASEPQSA